MWRSHCFDLIVLDVMLPDGDGMLLCQQIQRKYTTPVILLTAKDTLDDRVNGLEMGADDYVVKPFEPRELLARIHTVLRRAEKPATSPVKNTIPQPQEIKFAGLRFAPDNRSVTKQLGESIRLSTM